MTSRNVTPLIVLLLHLLLFIAPFGCTTTSPDIVSALTDIDQAIAASRQLASELTTYVSVEETRLSKLRRLIQRLENAAQIYSPLERQNPTSSSVSFPSLQEEAISNPVSAFLTILQLASNWTSELSILFGLPIINNTDRRTEQSEAASMIAFQEFDSKRRLFQQLKWYADMLPDDNDVMGAMNAIIRLQQTYNIPAVDIAEGRILPSSPSPQLTDLQCMRLGIFAYELGDYGCAVEWYRLVLDRLDKRTKRSYNTSEGLITHVMVYDYLSYALGRAGRYKEALEVTNKLLMEDPTSQNGALSKTFYEMELKRFNGEDPPHNDDESPRADDSEAAVFDSLCRRADTMSPPDHHLSCHYSTPHVFFTLAPLKEEVLQLEPPIVLWHDFVTQNEVDQIIEIAKPRLKRALVRNPTSGALEAAPYRVTKNVWLPDDMNALTKNINNRIRMATGLSIDHGEELQVANYGLGGYYAPHFDYARRFELDEYDVAHGNRIATTMIYLTAVELGGATAFTKTNAVVKPVPRSLVFWYNLLRSGDGDILSRHGACPVLVGSKWVMNKWIRAAGQEFTRPCLLQREPFNPQDEYTDS
ncbi:Prolyl 4-hydroxylase subunit alpha-2 [Taenia crassiceps]|uniref:procollagen-proline 4-dioxygenase n=1 Tax=Taenia crassiceps TaxID=6207 RepID=A0ABR4Q187_9CEST